VVGLVGLAQVPTPLEFLGIAAVVAAVALRSRDGDTPETVGRTGG
jgi:inner membrane transporter RhtA